MVALSPKTEELLLAAVGIVFISCRSIFAQSLTAKGGIYTLTLALMALVVLLRVLDRREKAAKFLFLAFLIWAAGMGNHWQTQVLWVPFLLFWSYEKKGFFRPKSVLLLLSLVLIGLPTYLYLPLRAILNCLPSWGYPIHPDLFYWVVSRQLVAGTEPWIQNFSFYFESFLEILRVGFHYWMPGFVFLVLTGMGSLWLKEKKLFLPLILLLGPVFLGIWAIHEQKNIYLMHAYLLSLAGLFTVFGFLGIRALLALAGAKPIRGWMVLFFTLISLGWLIHVFQLEDKSRYFLAGDFGDNVMKRIARRFFEGGAEVLAGLFGN